MKKDKLNNDAEIVKGNVDIMCNTNNIAELNKMFDKIIYSLCNIFDASSKRIKEGNKSYEG